MTRSWNEFTLADVVEINPPEDRLSSDSPFVPMDAIVVGRRFVTYFEPRGTRNGARARGGDILFARITPCLENGKVAQVPLSTDRCGGSTELIVLRETGDALAGFIYLWATSNRTRLQAARLMTGTTGRQRLSAHDLGSLVIRLPPVIMQRRICDLLDSIDLNIEATRRQSESLKSARAALLDELMFGNHEIPDSYDRLLGST